MTLKSSAEPHPAANTAETLSRRYDEVRAWTEHLCAPLVPEDYVVQSMPDVSPIKWHLAHTSWFFETFILVPNDPAYGLFDPHYAYLFNSYYVTVGDRHCRQNRGQLSRPTVADVYGYRRHVDDAMRALLRRRPEAKLEALRPVIELGLHHEQQHQELILTDIKHVFWVNPLRPAYRGRDEARSKSPPPLRWIAFDPGVCEIGHAADGFAFDNESPRHRVFLEPFELASRLITNCEFLAFIEDGGYRTPTPWLSEGYATVQGEQWEAPLYWIRRDGRWLYHTLSGLREVDPNEPVCHISYFEADAFARWAGATLPSEQQWESAAASVPVEGNFAESEIYHPAAPANSSIDSRGPKETRSPKSKIQRMESLEQMFGDVWEWTRSSYGGYPGYRPAAGALGEYNGKFMCNQYVLRGGSCATARSHIRRTYRNFFAPHTRWQFAGLRLAREAR